MGHTKQSHNRNGGSSGRIFLSPSTGTSSVPINTLVGKAYSNGPTANYTTFLRMLPYAIGVFGVAFLASCLTASIMTPVENSDATTQVDIHSNSVAYYVNIASASDTGVISKDIQATYMGTRGVITDTLNITSNTPQGYKVYISMANNTHGQYLYNVTDDNFHLSPTTGNTLSEANTWGVAVANTYNTNFSSNTTYITEPLVSDAKFMAVPAYHNETMLINRTGNTIQDGGTTDTIPVYYGYFTNSGLPSGTYSNTVLYTAYAEATDQAGGTAEASGKLASYKADNQTISFLTSLYTNRALTTSQATVTINGKACPVTAISQEGSGNDSIRVTCTAPSQDRPGTYNTIISIPDYGHTSTTTVEYDTPGITIASGPSAGTYKEMQEMTSDICEAWDEVENPANYDSTNHRPYAFTNGTTSPIYKYGSDLSLNEPSGASDSWAATNWSTIAATANATSASGISNINTDVPETYLYDNRDDNFYRIRKLADGNCWMTENLRLVFADDNGTGEIGTVSADGLTITGNGKYLTADNTNISSEVAESYKSTFVKTEVGTSVMEEKTAEDTQTVWGASADKHPTGGAVTLDETANGNSMAYSRSLYNRFTSNNLNFVGDGDRQNVGTYYNWKAATAGTGDMTTTAQDNSVCPKGWQLPNKDSDKSWNNLLDVVYGNGETSSGSHGDNYYQGSAQYNKIYGAHLIALYQTMKRAPLSIANSGSYFHNLGSVSNLTAGGYYWTKDSISPRYAANLYGYQVSYLFFYLDRQKGFGMTIRCVSQ